MRSQAHAERAIVFNVGAKDDRKSKWEDGDEVVNLRATKDLMHRIVALHGDITTTARTRDGDSPHT